MIVGYARVSTADQHPDRRIDAPIRAGVERADIHASGAKAGRPQCDAGDTTVQQIADLSGVSRCTVYGHLIRTTAATPA